MATETLERDPFVSRPESLLEALHHAGEMACVRLAHRWAAAASGTPSASGAFTLAEEALAFTAGWLSDPQAGVSFTGRVADDTESGGGPGAVHAHNAAVWAAWAVADASAPEQHQSDEISESAHCAAQAGIEAVDAGAGVEVWRDVLGELWAADGEQVAQIGYGMLDDWAGTLDELHSAAQLLAR